ncbi:MAG: hypothetical protein WAQ05_12570 [Rubrivivax sp.]
MKTNVSTLTRLALLALALIGNGAHAAPNTPVDVQRPAVRDCCGGAGGYEPPAGLNGWQPAQRQALPLSARGGLIGQQDPPQGLNGWQPTLRTALPTSGQR